MNDLLRSLTQKMSEWANRSFFERIAHSLIFSQKTSNSLRKPMSEFPALLYTECIQCIVFAKEDRNIGTPRGPVVINWDAFCLSVQYNCTVAVIQTDSYCTIQKTELYRQLMTTGSDANASTYKDISSLVLTLSPEESTFQKVDVSINILLSWRFTFINIFCKSYISLSWRFISDKILLTQHFI